MMEKLRCFTIVHCRFLVWWLLAGSSAFAQPPAFTLAEVLRLRPVSWLWKDHPERGQQPGLVAQEVEPVLPELVSTDKSAEQMKGLNYSGLLPVLVNPIQEQTARIEQPSQQLKQQPTQIERHQCQIGELKQSVKALKSSIHKRSRK